MYNIIPYEKIRQCFHLNCNRVISSEFRFTYALVQPAGEVFCTEILGIYSYFYMKMVPELTLLIVLRLDSSMPISYPVV